MAVPAPPPPPPRNGDRSVKISRDFPIIMPYLWSTRILDDRTQEQKDYDEAWEEVNRIAPGWRD